MGISAHRQIDIFVPHNLHYDSGFYAASRQVRTAGMPQGVKVQLPFVILDLDSGSFTVGLNHLGAFVPDFEQLHIWRFALYVFLQKSSGLRGEKLNRLVFVLCSTFNAAFYLYCRIFIILRKILLTKELKHILS